MRDEADAAGPEARVVGQPGDRLARGQAALRPRVEPAVDGRDVDADLLEHPAVAHHRHDAAAAVLAARPRAGSPCARTARPAGRRTGRRPARPRAPRRRRRSGRAAPRTRRRRARVSSSPTHAACTRRSLAAPRTAPAYGGAAIAACPALRRGAGGDNRPRLRYDDRAEPLRRHCMENVRISAFDLIGPGPGRSARLPCSASSPPRFPRCSASSSRSSTPMRPMPRPTRRRTGCGRSCATTCAPARRVMVWTVLVGPRRRACVEIWLIWYVGRLVDVLGDTPPAEVWARHGLELALVALFILLARPLIQTLSAALLNQSLMPNVGTIVRWRSHRHVLRQSVGWFQNDFAGRIANRMMQTAPAVGEATFQTFDAMVYAGDLPRRRALAARRHRPAARRCRWSSGSGSTSGWSPGRSRGSARRRRRSPTPARRSPGGSSTATPTSSR